MIRSLPASLQSRLVDPTAWVSSQYVSAKGSAAHDLLTKIWAVCADDFDNPDSICLAITTSHGVACHTISIGSDTYAATVSLGLVETLMKYSQARQMARHAGATSIDIELARRILNGTVRSDKTVDDCSDQASAVSQAVIGLQFLVLHQAAHIQADSVTATSNCLSAGSDDGSESAADGLAAAIMYGSATNHNEITASLTELFEMINWLEYKASGRVASSGRLPEYW